MHIFSIGFVHHVPYQSRHLIDETEEGVYMHFTQLFDASRINATICNQDKNEPFSITIITVLLHLIEV